MANEADITWALAVVSRKLRCSPNTSGMTQAAIDTPL